TTSFLPRIRPVPCGPRSPLPPLTITTSAPTSRVKRQRCSFGGRDQAISTIIPTPLSRAMRTIVSRGTIPSRGGVVKTAAVRGAEGGSRGGERLAEIGLGSPPPITDLDDASAGYPDGRILAEAVALLDDDLLLQPAGIGEPLALLRIQVRHERGHRQDDPGG